MADFHRQVIYAADTPKHGHTHRCLFPRTPLGRTIQPNTQTPRRDQRHAADIKLLMLLSHFVTSLATAVFSSLQRTTGVIFVLKKCVASAKPTVVTWLKILPPFVAADSLQTSNSYEMLQGFMLQIKEAQKGKVLYLGSFSPKLVFTAAKVV